MTSQSLLSFLPILATGITALLVLFCASFRCSHGMIAFMSALGLLISLVLTFIDFDQSLMQVNMPILIVDAYGLFMMQLMLIFGIILIIFSYEYWRAQTIAPQEYYILIILSLVGALVMVVSDHLASFFLGLELMTIPLYVLISYFSYKKHSLDAGVKYLILAGASTSLLLFGMAFIYVQTGTMSLIEINDRLNDGLVVGPLFLIGFALVLVGVGFKISAVPFHLWTADVYAGAPLPAAAYLATISKGATMALFLRLWQIVAPSMPKVAWIIAILAALSMIGGNLLAFKEDNLKRLLGYSSIAQFGYILMAILSSGVTAFEAFLFYLSAYGVTILLIFGALMCMESKRHEIFALKDFNSLFKTHRFLGIVLCLGLFSLMGIPFTAIFMGKVLVLMAGVESSQWILIAALLLSSILGLFVYLRIANAIFLSPNLGDLIPVKRTPWATSLLTMLAIATLALGLWPTLATNLMPLPYEQMSQTE
ncbi:MAG TPA: NADH-quinone oxidoreductase subunit N [Myxococcota bacterium]|nr:NADH-quinone oxidoreductase subunit N [Myxococcota bacterium]